MDFFDLGSIKAKAASIAFDEHQEMVNEYLLLLEQGYCLQIGCSYAKDSTCVLNGAIDAMHKAIELGYIEKSHPLVVINVDTLLEPEAIQCFVPHAYKAVKILCAKLGINLISKIVSPPIYQQLMTLYAGAQKLPATAASGRMADCSIIFKIDVSIAELKRIKSELPVAYQNRVWVSVSGSRSDESSRRSGNMKKQGVKNQKAHHLIAKVEMEGAKATSKVFKFAPIEHWVTPFVISYLNHCGNKPMAKTPINQRIPAFSENFGLLLAIYGEGSADACELVLKDDENKAEQTNCGKVGRFGCVTCGMVGEDNSSIELKKYARWGRFGDATLRLRDFIVRISSDVKYRAFHARAYDESSNNNVFMQPNSLRSKVLSKMVWYAAQITVDSRAIHDEAVRAYQSGQIELDVGVQDIMQDSSLSQGVKEEYKQMYIQRLIEKPMFEMFSEQHAVLLSLLWALHGVSAPSYHPVSILNNVKNGKRIPFPPTNKELNEKYASLGLPAWNDSSMINNEVPDALVIQLFKPVKKSFNELKAEYGNELNETHLQEHLPFELRSAWNRSSVHFDALGMTYNHIQSKAKETRAFKLSYTLNLKTGSEQIKAKDNATGRKIDIEKNQPLFDALLALGQGDYAQELEKAAEKQNMPGSELEKLRKQQGGTFEVTCNHAFNNQVNFTSDVKYISTDKLRKKGEAGKKFSGRKRVFCKKTGTYTSGRASLKVYSSSIVPELENQTAYEVKYWLPDFSIVRNSAINLHDDLTISEKQATQSFVFDNAVFDLWIAQGGWEMLVSEHDMQLRSLIKKRASVYSYGGTEPVYRLTSTSGLTTTAHFEKYMLETLKRTELFDNANLFNLSSLTYNKIASFKGVVEMSVHRQQKMDHLLAIRYLKNKRRTQIKAAQGEQLSAIKSKTVIANIHTRINEFFVQYNKIAEQYIAASALCAFSVDAKSRKQKIEIWLNEFGYVINDIDSALSLLATTQEREIINGDYDGKQIISNIYLTAKLALLSGLKAFTKQPLEIANKLNSDNFKKEMLIVDGHYESKGETKLNVQFIANWIANNYPRVNSFLIEHGLTTCLARMCKISYVCPVLGSPKSSNTISKIDCRSEMASIDFTNLCSALTINQTVFLALTKGSMSNSVGQVSTEAKSKKLSSLMRNKIKMMETLRVQ